MALRNILVNLDIFEEPYEKIKSIMSSVTWIEKYKNYEKWLKDNYIRNYSGKELKNELKAFAQDKEDRFYRWVKRQFYYDSTFILDYVLTKIDKVDCGECRHINLEFSKTPRTNNKRIAHDGGFYTYYYYFDYDNYFNFNIEERTLVMYNLLQYALKDCFKFMNWDYSQLDTAFKELKENNFETKYYLKKKVLNSEKIGARIYCKHYIDKIKFYIEFSRRNKFISRKFFLETKPSVMDYDRYLGDLVWKNDNTVVLYSRDGASSKVITFDNKEI